MKTKICEICGCEFKPLTLVQKYCSDCHEELYRSIKPEQPKRNPNQRLIDEVKAAAKAGLSYGNYMGRKKTNG